MKNFKSFIRSNEIDIVDEAESHQSKTTMKHISNPNAAEKKAAKDIKPGIKGVRDRLAMLRAAKDRGALKEDDLDEGLFDSIKRGYEQGLKIGLKQKIKPEHHDSYNIDSVKSTSDAASIIKKAKQAGHIHMKEEAVEEGEVLGKAKNKEPDTFQTSHVAQLAAAQAEIDRRHGRGENMKGARIDKNTYKVVKPKKRVMAKEEVVKALKGKIQGRNEDVDVEMLLNLYDNLDESNQEIFLAQLEEDAEVLLAFAKTIAEE